MWVAYALLSAFFAALVAIFAKIGIKGVDSDLATAIRTVVILFIAWGIVFFKGSYSTMGNITRHSWLFLVLSGAATGMSWLFYFRALQLGKVSQVAPIDKLSVALALILSYFILGEHMSLKETIGALLVIAGTLVLAL